MKQKQREQEQQRPAPEPLSETESVAAPNINGTLDKINDALAEATALTEAVPVTVCLSCGKKGCDYKPKLYSVASDHPWALASPGTKLIEGDGS